jgi:hypothetical protein
MNKDNLIMIRLYQAKWAGRRFDGKASAKIAKDAGAAPDTVRANKLIVPEAVIKPTDLHWGMMKKWFYEQTSPFYDTGWRVRPMHDFLTFRKEYTQYKDEAEKLVNTLITTTYPEAVANAEARMGDLYNSANYPNPEDLRDCFEIEIDLQQIPAITHNWLTKLDEESKIIVDNTTKKAETNVAQEPWLRLYTPLNRLQSALSTRVGEKGSVFKNSTVETLPTICDTAVSIAVDPNDTDLQDAVYKIRNDIAVADTKKLRTEAAYRAFVLRQITNVLKIVKNNI